MKIAITSLGKNPKSEISPQAGRAPYYLIFEDGKLIEAWKNVFSVGGGGVSLAVSKIMADKGVNKVISVNFADKMINTLKEKGIDFEEKTGIVEDVL